MQPAPPSLPPCRVGGWGFLLPCQGSFSSQPPVRQGKGNLLLQKIKKRDATSSSIVQIQSGQFNSQNWELLVNTTLDFPTLSDPDLVYRETIIVPGFCCYSTQRAATRWQSWGWSLKTSCQPTQPPSQYHFTVAVGTLPSSRNQDSRLIMSYLRFLDSLMLDLNMSLVKSIESNVGNMKSGEPFHDRSRLLPTP